MSDDIERHVLRKYEIAQKLGKGVSSEACGVENNDFLDSEFNTNKTRFVIIFFFCSIQTGLRHRLESSR